MNENHGSGDGPGRDRLPPPAFPRGKGAGRPVERELGDALISPDEPVIRDGAPSVPEDFEEVMSRIRPEDLLTGDVVVTGMGDDPHLELGPHVERWGDLHLARLIAAVEHLGTELRERGEAGLKSRAGMSRFEVTLRAYCVGYLNGLRAHDAESTSS